MTTERTPEQQKIIEATKDKIRALEDQFAEALAPIILGKDLMVANAAMAGIMARLIIATVNRNFLMQETERHTDLVKKYVLGAIADDNQN